MTKLAVFLLSLFSVLAIQAYNNTSSICDDRLDTPCEYLEDLRDTLGDDFADSALTVFDEAYANNTNNDDLLFNLASLIYTQAQDTNVNAIYLLGPSGELLIASDKIVVFDDVVEWCKTKELTSCITKKACGFKKLILQAQLCDGEGWEIESAPGIVAVKYARRLVGPRFIVYYLVGIQIFPIGA
eukprot:TRINITY_DN300_c0_g1_i1.p1 TRINITY_DN300_c0_g1~~TRINITY_DN300_c0_g1_i1.p1  ORF type:complete len:185 (+),score=26.98 TRINITY_DN300_c0_g1_i1:58-612(+)